MKSIMFILSATLIFFSSCSKMKNDDIALGSTPTAPPNTLQEMPAANPLTTADISHPASMGFTMHPMGDSNPVIIWNNGYATITSTGMDGYETVDGMKQKMHFENNNTIQVNLFEPAYLGNFIIAGIRYSSIHPVLVFAPLKTPPGNSGSDASLFLEGKYLGRNNDIAQVRITVSRPVAVSAVWSDELMIKENTNWNGNLFFNISRVTRGITYDILKQAERTADGVIIISETHNQQLYQMVISNLQNALAVQFQ